MTSSAAWKYGTVQSLKHDLVRNTQPTDLFRKVVSGVSMEAVYNG